MRKATLLIFLLFSATHAQTYESGRWAWPSAQAARDKLTDTAVASQGWNTDWVTGANLYCLRAKASPSPSLLPTPTPTPLPTPTPTPAPISTPTPIPCVLLPDDFNDNSRDAARWKLGVLSAPAADALVTVLEQNQQLEIQPRANTAGNHYNGYVSALTWNLTNTHTSVEVVSAPTGGSDTIFAIGNDNNNCYRFVVSGELLYFQERFEGVLTQASIAFDASHHRFWRFRHDPGTDQVIFETSPNGVTNWNDRRTVQRHFALTAVRVELTGGSAQSLAAPDKSVFDNLVQNNECPTPTPTPTPLATATPTPARAPTPRGPTINVKEFGAKGNGQADDTAAIRSALAVSITRTRPLYFPTGIYLIDARDRSEFGIRIDGAVNVKIVGDGIGKTVIRFLQKLPLVDSILNPIVLRHGASATFEDLEIVGPTPRTANTDGGGAWASPYRVTYGILDFAGARPSSLTMNRVKISGVTHGIKVDFTDGHAPVDVKVNEGDISAGSQGILMTNSGKLTIRNSTFHDTGSTSGINASRDHHVYVYLVKVDIQNSTFRDCGGFVVQALQEWAEWTPTSPPPPPAIDVFKNNKIGPNQGRGLLTSVAHRMYAEGNDFNTIDANISVYGDADLVNNKFAGTGPALLDYSGIAGTKTIRAKGNAFNNGVQPIQKISTNPNISNWILHLGDNKFATVGDMIFLSTAPVDRVNEVRFYSGNVWAGTGRIYSVNGKIFGKDAGIPADRRGPGNFVDAELGELTIPTPKEADGWP